MTSPQGPFPRQHIGHRPVLANPLPYGVHDCAHAHLICTALAEPSPSYVVIVAEVTSYSTLTRLPSARAVRTFCRSSSDGIASSTSLIGPLGRPSHSTVRASLSARAKLPTSVTTPIEPCSACSASPTPPTVMSGRSSIARLCREAS